MYSDDDLQSAVEAGVLSQRDAEAFRDYMAKQHATPLVHDEHFRLITGFNDVFVVIACLLVLVSIHWIGSSVDAWVGPALGSVMAWGLAEYFTRVRHMALPSILLLVAFVGGVFSTSMSFGILSDYPGDKVAITASLMATLAAWLHWLRFQVPITVAAGVGALITAVFTTVLTQIDDADAWLNYALMLTGLVVLTLAIRWDATDRERKTRRSDVAFWLHLLAAPILVHSVFSELNLYGGTFTVLAATGVLVLYLLMALISLALDRRAIMVSALAYVLYSMDMIFEAYGVVSLSFSLAAFVIGSGLLMLTAFWHQLRALLMAMLPASVHRWLPALT